MFKALDIGKYMTALITEVKPKTVVQTVNNKHHGNKLGTIHWYGPWRMYTFAIGELEFSPSCLRELADFVERETKMHKAFHTQKHTVEEKKSGN